MQSQQQGDRINHAQDRSRFEALYSECFRGVYGYIFARVQDTQTAEDITSETFIRAWARNSTIRTETLKAYLFTIARNVYLERLRQSKRRVDLKDVYPDPSPGPEELLESRLELLRVKRMLGTLPEIDRAAFVLRVQHELPYAEIARILELSLTAAKVKVHRVRKKLLTSCVDMEIE